MDISNLIDIYNFFINIINNKEIKTDEDLFIFLIKEFELKYYSKFK